MLANYELNGAYDEMFEGAGRARSQYAALLEELASVAPDDLRRRQLVTAGFVMLAVTVAAAAIPAWRAGRVSPMTVLRGDA